MSPSEVAFYTKNASQSLLNSEAFNYLYCANFKDMSKLINLVGKKYGRLTVISRAENRSRYVVWNCLCDCGNTHLVQAGKLRSGNTRSCGCFQIEVISNLTRSHSDTGSKEYIAWAHIKSRCTRPEDSGYKWYGARGIKMHPEWIESYESFLEYVGRAPSVNHSIDRMNNDGHYEPGNVRWATKREQSNNRSCTTFLEFQGQKRPFTEWCEITKIPYRTLRTRLAFGWTVDRALSTPNKSRKCLARQK